MSISTSTFKSTYDISQSNKTHLALQNHPHTILQQCSSSSTSSTLSFACTNSSNTTKPSVSSSTPSALSPVSPSSELSLECFWYPCFLPSARPTWWFVVLWSWGSIGLCMGVVALEWGLLWKVRGSERQVYDEVVSRGIGGLVSCQKVVSYCRDVSGMKGLLTRSTWGTTDWSYEEQKHNQVWKVGYMIQM